MTIEKLIESLNHCVKTGSVKPTDEVVFRHSIHAYDGNFSEVDYILTRQVPDAVTLCYDDGMM